jgi:hypothetical protein
MKSQKETKLSSQWIKSGETRLTTAFQVHMFYCVGSDESIFTSVSKDLKGDIYDLFESFLSSSGGISSAHRRYLVKQRSLWGAGLYVLHADIY